MLIVEELPKTCFLTHGKLFNTVFINHEDSSLLRCGDVLLGLFLMFQWIVVILLQSQSPWTAYDWRWRPCDLLEHHKLHTQRHSITYQKTFIQQQCCINLKSSLINHVAISVTMNWTLRYESCHVCNCKEKLTVLHRTCASF